MPQGSLKSIALVIGATAFAVCAIAISLLDYTIPAAGDLVWISLLLLSTVAAGRFKLSLTNADGNNQSQNTLAVAFIFLGGMLYGIPAAALLAAIDSLLATRHERNRRIRVFSVSAAIVSIWLALTIYQLLLQMLTGGSVAGGGVLPFGSLFLPMAALALVQYALNTLVTTAFVAFETGKARLVLSRESFVWTATAQLAGASSAALFYAAWQGSGLSYLFVGAIITPLVYLLYRFNAQHVAQVRRAQAEQLRHVEEIAALHMNTIESLAIAIDAKDQTTHGHVRRTQIYALELGKILGVSESELMALRAGALLHDVGKLAVPEYILNKPGKLTAAEFEKMKIHTVVGGDIIKRVNFPYPVEEIVRFHHEKWDGSGYPKGLREAQIPLVARIISVVDFYDATRCDRPYRVGMKREEALGLLRRMAGNSFDPRVVETFIANIEFFDRLIAEQGIQEQVTSEDNPGLATARPDAGLASDVLGAAEDEHSSLGKLVEAQRELLALHEISQTIGSSLNLQDTLTLVAGKLRAILPYDTCAIYLVDERTCKATALHVAGTHAEIFAQRRITVGEGITGWVIANARSMCNTPPELDLIGIPEEVTAAIKGVLISPLVREDGAFGAIALYSTSRATYTTDQVRLLESVAHHAASALNNALVYEKTRESALVDLLTELPNARAFHHSLEQRIAECQRLNQEPLTVLSMDLDDFKKINDTYGHGVGDQLLAEVATVIKKQLRQMDLLARYAGDEFVAIMPMASAEVAEVVAERIRGAVESHYFRVRVGRTAGLGISIGQACFPAGGETAEQLLNAAARSMQQDKHVRRLQPDPHVARGSGALASIEAFR